MPILDNLDLGALAREARQRDRWAFLFVGLPLRVQGGNVGNESHPFRHSKSLKANGLRDPFF